MRSFLKSKLKKNKAITLIALVITIVILIILAGVVISLSLGNNGLFNKAKEAKEKYINAQDYEETEIARVSNEIDDYVDGNRNSNLASQTSGTATATDIAKGKTAWVNGEMITGTYENSTKGVEWVSGTFSSPASGTRINIPCGFQPAKVCCYFNNCCMVYTSEYGSWYTDKSNALTSENEVQVTNNGFSYENWDPAFDGKTIYYFAVKE